MHLGNALTKALIELTRTSRLDQLALKIGSYFFILGVLW